ncbi:hypothetical protein NQ318_001846 [Aromia moschata]|uniref:Uncharacterized protein n=1 Tax=Aromia moschata TaxID=1265417 RepID=A0AAV8Z1U6_9CUCU|nr:hypothetical protein NQ318_001846 [Aromia moschata]
MFLDRELLEKEGTSSSDSECSEYSSTSSLKNILGWKGNYFYTVCLKFNDLAEYDEEDNDAEKEQENNPITNNSSSSKREKILENICRK